MKATLEARARNELREHEVTDLCLKDLNGIPEAGMAEGAPRLEVKVCRTPVLMHGRVYD